MLLYMQYLNSSSMGVLVILLLVAVGSGDSARRAQAMFSGRVG